MNADQLVERYVLVRDKIAQMKQEFEAAVLPYNEALGALEGAMGEMLQATGQEALKTAHGTAYKSSTLSVRTADKGVFMSFVEEANRLDLLEVRPSKDAVKTYMEEHDNEPPPGVDVATVVNIRVRRS